MPVPKISRKPDISIGTPAAAWFVTYSDLITQLLIFFVMLFALSSAMNELQLTALQRKLQAYIDKNSIQEYVGLNRNEKGLVITLKEKFMFDSGQAEIYDDAKRILSGISIYIIPYPNEISIEGHTDNVPISRELKSKYESNWELSTARATNVAKYLISGMQERLDERLKTAGYNSVLDIAGPTFEEVMKKTGLKQLQAEYVVSLAKTIAVAAGELKTIKEGEGEKIAEWERFIDTANMTTVTAKQVLKSSVSVIKQFGFDPARLSSAGYAEYHPVAGSIMKQTLRERDQNRRVDIVVKRIGFKKGAKVKGKK